MNNLIKISPIYNKKKRQYHPSEYSCEDTTYLINKLKQFSSELSVLSEESENEIAFELYSTKKIPPKSSRIQIETLRLLEWDNKGSRYDQKNGIIIIILCSHKNRIKKIIDSVKVMIEIIEKHSIDFINQKRLDDLFIELGSKPQKTELKKAKEMFYNFVEKHYKNFLSRETLSFDVEKEYIGTVLCNANLFENFDKINCINSNFRSKEIVFKSKEIDRNNYKYLMNIQENKKINFNNSSFSEQFYKKIDIPDHTNKIIIGALDGNSPLMKNVNLKNYVNVDDSNLHGQWVSSILMFGDKLNNFDDGCGVYRVQLCRVMSNRSTEFDVIKNVELALIDYPDIRIWNFSMGSSDSEINPFEGISFLGRKLDELAKIHNVIFVLSGGNDCDKSNNKFINPPADSLRNLTVNAICSDGKPASYSKKGASFLNFHKPECAAFGGDDNSKCLVFSAGRIHEIDGTSFSAPFVSRIIAGIMEKFPDSSNLEIMAIFLSGLNYDGKWNQYTGFGCVKTNLNNFINSKDNEIKILLSGKTVENQKISYSDKFSIPVNDGHLRYKISVTSVCDPIIDYNFGVESIRTCTTIDFVESSETNTVSVNLRVVNLEKNDINIPEYELIKQNKKWSNKQIKIYDKRCKKYLDGEFFDWTLFITNENRATTNYDELTQTSIDYAIVIKLENTDNINNFQRMYERLKINNMSPSIMNISTFNLDYDIILKK